MAVTAEWLRWQGGGLRFPELSHVTFSSLCGGEKCHWTKQCTAVPSFKTQTFGQSCQPADQAHQPTCQEQEIASRPDTKINLYNSLIYTLPIHIMFYYCVVTC